MGKWRKFNKNGENGEKTHFSAPSWKYSPSTSFLLGILGEFH